MVRLIVLATTLIFCSCTIAQDSRPFMTNSIASLDEPWAIEFLPDGRMLITEKPGRVLVVSQNGQKSEQLFHIK